MKDTAVLGWREFVNLPELRLAQVKAKVDTGARSSSLHAFDIEFFKDGGREHVRFKVHPLQKDSSCVVKCSAPLLDVRLVKSSTGKAQRRAVIRTRVDFGNESRDVELTLTSRDEMGFRMLIGREAIRGRFLVDPGGSFYLGKRKSKGKKKRSKPAPKKRKKA